MAIPFRQQHSLPHRDCRPRIECGVTLLRSQYLCWVSRVVRLRIGNQVAMGRRGGLRR